MEGIPPHVPAGQRLVEGEHHGVVLGVRLVAALSDPARVVRQRVMEAPGSTRSMLAPQIAITQTLSKTASQRRGQI